MKKLFVFLACIGLLASMMCVSAANTISKDSPNHNRQLTEEEVFESFALTYNDSKLLSVMNQKNWKNQVIRLMKGFMQRIIANIPMVSMQECI